MSKCALCGQRVVDRGNEHLLFKCTDAKMVEVRKEVEAAVERGIARLAKPSPVKWGNHGALEARWWREASRHWGGG